MDDNELEELRRLGLELPNMDDALMYLDAPQTPTTVMEALQQRLDKYSATLEEAKEASNAPKVRRLGRIVKQYENAIKSVTKGVAVELNDLPTPPGFAPFPTETISVQSNQTKQSISSQNTVTNVLSKGVEINNLNDATLKECAKVSPLEPSTTPTKPTKAAHIPVKQTNNSLPNSSSESTTKIEMPSKPVPQPKPATRPVLKRASSTANKQLNYLLERQKLFKEAALNSKQKGDIQQAKEYLRMAKGFDPLIEATQNGLPIDATSIPTPPQIGDDFVVVSLPDSQNNGDDNLEREEIYRKIEIELQNQIEMCNRNKDYFLQFGDVSTASKFEKYAIDSKKDMDMLIARWRGGDKVPSFKYETRTFSIVICNTEVAINEISLEVIKAIDIPAKNDVDTYVKIEFPFPKDNPQVVRTKTVKNSIYPVFNETFKFEIDRKSRQLPRVFKRHPLKLELFSKGGFLRSDALIGSALIKLTDLENKCTIYDSFALTEGRKTVGGKLEARVKIREPLLSKQVEEVKEKWLVFT